MRCVKISSRDGDEHIYSFQIEEVKCIIRVRFIEHIEVFKVHNG